MHRGGPAPRRERLIWAEPRTPGMGPGEVRLENIGPIRRAAIGAHRLSVFIGPNNSGKSIASRLIHAARRLGPRDGRGNGAAAAHAGAVLRRAGMKRPDVVTRSMRSGRIEMRGNGAGGAVLEFGPGDTASAASYPPPPADSDPDGAGESSIYIPAGRAGAIRSLSALMRTRGCPESGPRAPAGGTGRGTDDARPEASAPQLGTGDQVPDHLDQLCGIVHEAFSGGLGAGTEELFSRVFPGSIKVSDVAGLPAFIYVDPLGFETVIDSAASGVASALPVVLALSRVGPAGTLVVEDPEERIEPIRQIKLVDEMVRAASARGISMVITTHSPFVANAVLGLVVSGDVDPDDLGMYYFRRRRGSYTEVERISVNRAGEAEQEMFDEAVDALAYGSVVPDAP